MAGGNPLLRDLTKSGAGSAQPHGAQYGQAPYGTPYQQPGHGPAGYQQGGYGRAPQGAPYSADRLDAMYGAPAAGTNETGRMTYDDVVMRTAMVLGAVVLGALAGWIMPVLTLPGALIGFVLAMVNVFKRQPSPALILAYGVFEGMFLGGISGMFEAIYPGIVVQAVIGTIAVFGSVLVLFKSGKLRASASTSAPAPRWAGGWAWRSARSRSCSPRTASCWTSTTSSTASRPASRSGWPGPRPSA